MRRLLIVVCVLSMFFIDLNQVHGKANTLKENFSNVVLFAQFSGENQEEDKAFFKDEKNTQEIIKIYNGTHGRSFQQYMKSISYDQFHVHNIFPQYDGTSINSYTLSLTANQTKNKYADALIISELLNNIPDIQNQVVDYDGDGYIDNLTIILRGNPDYDEKDYPTLVSHKSDYTGNEIWSNKKVHHYNMINTCRLMEDSSAAKAGVVAHEFLHTLGYPDLYRKGGGDLPVYIWDIMAQSNMHIQYPLAYMRMHFSHWIDIKTIKQSQSLVLDSQDNAQGNQAYILKSPLSDSEFFVVEFRKFPGYEISEDSLDRCILNSGVIVYRINTRVEALSNYYGKTGVYVFRPQVGQNGYSENMNVTAMNAYLSKESGRTSIGSSCMSDTLEDGALSFSDGSNSGIVISNVSSSSGNQMTLDVSIPSKQDFDLWEDTQYLDKDFQNYEYSNSTLADYQNHPYMMVYKNYKYTLYKYDNTWQQVASPINEGLVLSSSLFVHKDKLYFAYLNRRLQFVLKQYNETSKSWITSVTKDIQGYEMDVKSDDKAIYIAYTTGSKAHFATIENNQFKDIETFYSQGSCGQSHIVVGNNKVYMSIIDMSKNVHVYQYHHKKVSQISQNLLQGNSYDMITIGDKLYVALTDDDLRIYCYDGKWNEGKQLLKGNINAQLMENQGNIYVATYPTVDSGKTTVYEFDESNQTLIQEGESPANQVLDLSCLCINQECYVSYHYDNAPIIVKKKKLNNEFLSLRITPPLKTVYYQGDIIDESGLRVEAVYKNGEKVLNKNQYAISQFQTQKIGTFKAIVSFGNQKVSFNYQVKAKPIINIPIINLKLDKTTLTINKDSSTTLKATITPANATNKALTWTSSNNKVVTVNNGVIKGIRVGTATITVKTVNGKTATCKVTVQAVKPKVTKISILKTKTNVKNVTYTGKTLKPKVTVKYGKKTLKNGIDYTLNYKNNKNIGKATITIKGKGSYMGSKIINFYIVPKKVTISSVKPGKKQLTVKYKKVTGASGYQIAYSTSKSKGFKYITVNSKTASKVIKKLKSKKNYYVKVRAYKMIGKKKYYGSYSSIKSVKVK